MNKIIIYKNISKKSKSNNKEIIYGVQKTFKKRNLF